MKTKILFLSLLLMGIFTVNTVQAEDEERNVAVFSEIGLNIPATLYLTQGSTQELRIVAKPSTLEDIITEVKGRRLTIRFPNKNIFKQNFNPGKIEIYLTVPEVDALGISGSGDIISGELTSRILEMVVSGSGNVKIEKLDSKKVKASISGSGNINIGSGGVAEELVVTISGSGNFNGKDFEAEEVSVRTSGSGNCSVMSNGSLKARVLGSGNITYVGNPAIDATIAGSGKVKEI